jgi:uncharacterized protein
LKWLLFLPQKEKTLIFWQPCLARNGDRKKDVDNGIVFLIATEDHTMAIQQGRAVEQYLTASVAGQILDYIVTPHFKQGEWYEGINGGTSAIMEAVQGKFKPLNNRESGNGDGSIFKIIIIAFVIFIIIAILFGNKGGGKAAEIMTTTM